MTGVIRGTRMARMTWMSIMTGMTVIARVTGMTVITRLG